MAKKPKQQDRSSSNEGEGDRTAARQDNKAQRRFAQSGKVDKPAREPERALRTPEKRVMDRAAAVGKSHERAEDPAITRKY
jgi:hypothetical protein